MNDLKGVLPFASLLLDCACLVGPLGKHLSGKDDPVATTGTLRSVS